MGAFDRDGGLRQAGEAQGLKHDTVGQGGLACIGGYYFPGDGPGGGFRGDGKCCKNVNCHGAEGQSFLNLGNGGPQHSSFCDHGNGGFGGGGSTTPGFPWGEGGGRGVGYSGGTSLGTLHKRSTHAGAVRSFPVTMETSGTQDRSTRQRKWLRHFSFLSQNQNGNTSGGITETSL